MWLLNKQTYFFHSENSLIDWVKKLTKTAGKTYWDLANKLKYLVWNSKRIATSVSNLSPAMGARNQIGKGLFYRPASLCSLATQFQTRFLESIPRPMAGLKFSTQIIDIEKLHTVLHAYRWKLRLTIVRVSFFFLYTLVHGPVLRTETKLWIPESARQILPGVSLVLLACKPLFRHKALGLTRIP